MIEQAFKEFIDYIKKPDPFIKEAKSSVFFNQLFPLIIISLSFSFLAVMMTSTLEQLHIIPKMPEFNLFRLKEKKLYLFLMIVIGAPIIEEFIFRFQLKNFSFSFVGYFAIFWYILTLFLETRILVIVLLILAVILILIYYTISFRRFKKLTFIKSVFPYHFYLTAICFGLVHITNYENPVAYGFPIILLVLPQLFLGLILGYVRMRFGLSKSMMMHAAYNFIPALALIAGY